MELWQVINIFGIALLILEMLTPTMFFLNLAIGAFITAGISLWITNIPILITLFAVISAIILIFIRPMLYKKLPDDNKTGIDGKYIGKNAKAETDISKDNGVISIYGERWEARNINNEIIPAGSEVKIVRNESLIMFVEKI